MIFNRENCFKTQNDMTLEERVLALESKTNLIESQLKMTIDTDPCFYRGYQNPPEITLIRAINLILSHFKIRLYEVPPIGSQYVVKTEKEILEERKKKNEPS
jgi:hypothetical protein